MPTELPTTPLEERIPSFPPGIWDALQRPAAAGPATRTLASFPNGVLDVYESDASDEGTSLNKFDLVCPQDGCGSIILKSGVGKWVERSSVELDPPNQPVHPRLPALPAPPATAHWWLITPSPMAFENIGFTQPVQSANAGAKKLKLLICAECDLGALGWSEEGGTEFWLACSRVNYRA
ncbi:hypothetical protein SERLA73DRAFT_144035 [Serpula lacrymans var. lacrymans S7.3]|uniref:Mss4-like protein n=2 Tax=Serpula lacrymans var. lacrymans TaxID=341189 RepID=F8QAX5_SERL3|nr:uncharacterized protein SERLADRAFT_401072 [Serpula lacrymans var. lacrymans S7.9]EGN94361.1 hypothetical protein SERLA73DRAFT_144035 [Serpula lacrymans var. lacrymans S7.3]EGO19843.1 hypothetical protein SERLADRAFT_401072 [Serpula lacrymans var. lacrymans S7.9]